MIHLSVCSEPPIQASVQMSATSGLGENRHARCSGHEDHGSGGAGRRIGGRIGRRRREFNERRGCCCEAACCCGPAAATPLAATTPSCNLGNGVKHVVEITFDNVHFFRDNPNVPSDLEMMPHLLNFLKDERDRVLELAHADDRPHGRRQSGDLHRPLR